MPHQARGLVPAKRHSDDCTLPITSSGFDGIYKMARRCIDHKQFRNQLYKPMHCQKMNAMLSLILLSWGVETLAPCMHSGG